MKTREDLIAQFAAAVQLLAAATCLTHSIDGQSRLSLRSTSDMDFFFWPEIQNMNLKPENLKLELYL